MSEVPTTVRAGSALHAERSVAALDSRLGGEHMPRRPQWDCQACEQSWPCDPARVRLAEEFGTNRVNLSMYVSGLLDVALEELPTVATADLYDRFVAWTR
ncbi:hypothetical protein ACFYPG_21100 [Micromonospora sp. NPDC005553]|uniref:hypothetical protein n=1 Tax=Micromonospora sp. NPDC005553 TaxID=3364232 RepID=UPI00368CE25F